MDADSADRSDRDELLELAACAESFASDLPAGLSPFEVSGEDPLSLAIAGKVRDIEGVIHDDLIALKAEVTALAFEIQDEAKR